MAFLPTTGHDFSTPARNATPKEPVRVSAQRDIASLQKYMCARASTRLLITAGAVIIYLLLYFLLYANFDSAKSSPIAAIIPVVIIGWLFGFMPGVLAGLCSFPVNIGMNLLLGLDWWDMLMADGSGIIGSAALVLLGGIVGRMHDLTEQSRRDRDELDAANQRLQQEIREHQRTSAGMRKAELALIQSKESAEAANRSKSSFLANMSHEIRTPMNAVIGFTDLLIDSSLNHEQNDYARTIRDSCEGLLAVINDILDFSKIEAGKIDFEEIDFDIEVVAYDVCDLMRPRIEKSDVAILCRIGDNLPAQVVGDPHRFRQVLVNLMGNAAKFTAKGEIELTVDVEEEQQGRFLIHTTVRDTGIGIEPGRLESIFDVFQQADGSITRKHGGTGLGLSICRKIARLMEGDVWAESTPGQGSVFHFTCRLKQSPNRDLRRTPPVNLSGKKILLTDENPSSLEILTSMVQAAGMQAVAFTGSAEALKTMQDALDSGHPFDICLLDLGMADMTGYRLAKIIRAMAGDQLPLLAISSTSDVTAKSCVEAGFHGFLPKPVNRIKLLKMMGRLLGEAVESTGEERRIEIVTQHSMLEDAKHATSILIAEDNLVNQKLAVKLLGKAGYRVYVAANGSEVIEMVTDAPARYDIILMDVQMPVMCGLEATRMLRTLGYTDIPIIAMTAGAMKGDRERCLSAGMNDYIAKPIKREIVFQMLRKWVMEKV